MSELLLNSDFNSEFNLGTLRNNNPSEEENLFKRESRYSVEKLCGDL